MRFAIAAPDEVLADLFDPLRVYACHATREQARGLGELRRHDPFSGFFLQIRTGMHDKADTACTQIVTLLFRLAADVAEQPRQQGTVNLFVGRRRRIELPTKLGGQGMQLAMDIAPLA